MTTSLIPERRETLQRRIRWIVAVTIGYNVMEAVVAITAGTVASSGALIAFGLDSTIEVVSAAAVAWQFTRRDPERWEKPTLRVIAVAFFALAAYVITTSLLTLIGRVEAEHSALGILITALSVIIMPLLSLAERRAGRELGSGPAGAGSDRKWTRLETRQQETTRVGGGGVSHSVPQPGAGGPRWVPPPPPQTNCVNPPRPHSINRRSHRR